MRGKADTRHTHTNSEDKSLQPVKCSQLPISGILGPREARLKAEMQTDYVPIPIGLSGPRMPGMPVSPPGQHPTRPVLNDAKVNSPAAMTHGRPPTVTTQNVHSELQAVDTPTTQNNTEKQDYKVDHPDVPKPPTPLYPPRAPPPPPPISSMPSRRPGKRSPSKGYGYGQRLHPSHASTMSLQSTNPSIISAKIPLTPSTAPPAPPPPPPISSIPTRRLQSSQRGKGRPSSSSVTYARQGKV